MLPCGGVNGRAAGRRSTGGFAIGSAEVTLLGRPDSAATAEAGVSPAGSCTGASWFEAATSEASSTAAELVAAPARFPAVAAPEPPGIIWVSSSPASERARVPAVAAPEPPGNIWVSSSPASVRLGNLLNEGDGLSFAGGFRAPFAPRTRWGNDEDDAAGLLCVARSGPALRSSAVSCPPAVLPSSSVSRTSDAAAAARKRSTKDSGSTGRSTRAGDRAPFVPRTRRGSRDDGFAASSCSNPPSAAAVVGTANEDSPCVVGAVSALSAGWSPVSGEDRDGGTRLSSRMRNPPGGVGGTPQLPYSGAHAE